MRRLVTVVLILLSLNTYAQIFSYKEKKELKGYSDYIMDCKFSPFRNYFGITVGDNSIEIYDKNWKKIYYHQGNPSSVGGHIAFSPDEKYLAYAKYKSDNDIAIINLHDQKVVQVLNGHEYHINKVVFSHDGNYLVSTSSDKTLCVWKWNDDQMVLNQKISFNDAVMGASFSFDDRYLVAAGNDRNIYIYQKDKNKYKLLDSVSSKSNYKYDVTFHPYKYEFLSASQDDVRRYVLTKSNYVFKDSIEARVNRTIKYNSTGEYAVFGSTRDVVILKMDEHKISEFEQIYRHSEHVFGGSFSDDGMFLTTFGSDKSSIVWELTGINPSKKTLITDYVDGELTSAQKIILTAEVIDQILKKTDTKLTAPRDEFETSIQYNDRRAELKSEVLLQLQTYTEKHYSVQQKAGNKLIIPIERIIAYNADLGIYKIRFLETDAGVEIPVEAAKSFKLNWTKAFIQADKNRSDDKNSYEYSNFKLLHPTNSKSYDITPVENPFHSVKNNRNAQIQKGRAENSEIIQLKNVNGEDNLGTDRALIFATNIYDSFSELVNPVLDAQTFAEELQSNYFVQTDS